MVKYVSQRRVNIMPLFIKGSQFFILGFNIYPYYVVIYPAYIHINIKFVMIGNCKNLYFSNKDDK